KSLASVPQGTFRVAGETGLRLKSYSSEYGESMLRRCVYLSREAKDIYYKRCPGSFSNSADDGIILNHHSILMAAPVTSYAADLPMVLNTGGLT
nr:selenocysteine methyltransferase [Tanacetum cinerariifolium]